MAKTKELKVAVDHPQDGERIIGSHYAFRISAPGDIERVEVSINQGSWESCREAAGYWWYDWSGDAVGKHQIMARAQTKDGKSLTSHPRQFWVASEPAETSSAVTGSV